MPRFILSVDQSTSATKAVLFDDTGNLVHRESAAHHQYYPQDGFVEHDGAEIYTNTLEVIGRCVNSSGVSQADLAALAITNQRETVVIWDRETGVPICNAAVWQCLRGEEICKRLTADGHAEMVKEKTGLIVDPYFSASKIKWMLDNIDGARDLANAGRLAFGTIESWLVWKLTGGISHVTDYSNACRTLLFDIGSLSWSPELFALFDIPASMAPTPVVSDKIVGHTKKNEPLDVELPIAGLMGDSHAALFGERCFALGSAKATYGTGSSIMMNIGPRPLDSDQGIVTSIGYGLSTGVTYAFEGNIHSSGGTIQWLVEDIGLIESAADSQAIAQSVESNGGVYLVPAFVGLGAPYWDSEARATISGMSRSTAKAHIVRAAEESIAYQVRDLLEVMREEAGTDMGALCADGGATGDAFLMQFQADILDLPVQCAAIKDVSALGAAYAAGLAVGLWSGIDELSRLGQAGIRYSPNMKDKTRSGLVAGWKKAVARTRWQP